MAIISGILKDPIGGARVGVVIELRAVRTSATVINQARSQSITDATGKYTLTVEPGAYDVMITASGRQPERVGGIAVLLNSQAGTLNDFLTAPGETDLNPEIVATVDRMRAEAAASAAVSANGLSGALKNLNFSPTEAVANAAWRKVGTVKNLVQGGQTIVIRIGGTASYNGHPNANGLVDIVIRTGSGAVTSVNAVGHASVSAFVTNGTGAVSSTQLISNLGLIETAVNTFDLYLQFNPFVSGISAAISATSISHIADNWSWGKTEVAAPAIVLEREIIKVWTEGSLPNPLKVGDYGLGAGPSHQEDTKQAVGRIYRVTTSSLNKPTAESLYGVLSLPMDGSPTVGYVFVSATGKLRTGLSGASGTLTSYSIWGDYNTTVDANGFIKKASPIVKLFGDGTSELNDQSQGVTTERISAGVYRVSGTLGFNSDAEWGGVDGGIEIPTDRNKLPLVWVDYEVDEYGVLLIKTFHRANSSAPAFAKNTITGYKDGQPIDIPVGRWIDLRVEMPAGDEPEPVIEPNPIPEPEVAPEPDTDQQPEAEVEQPVAPEQGDTPEAETKE
ncbi:prophage tail fiber N-terminal domain-containing protein [Chania multitudinisentens]|uniref:phage tail fiber protein n=1 Tax=Chania multitudinisentens TaxID=1639108 RepID=UPI0003E12904|nr:prophage tail fiber N-terminal domain-containing protein [Chania multitudinisentens]